MSQPRVAFEFVVEKIIGVSGDGSYQVQWAPAWVNKCHLIGCEHLIQEFLRQQPETEVGCEHLVQEILGQQPETEVKIEPENEVEEPSVLSSLNTNEDVHEEPQDHQGLDIKGGTDMVPCETQQCYVDENLDIWARGTDDQTDSQLFGMTKEAETNNNMGRGLRIDTPSSPAKNTSGRIDTSSIREDHKQLSHSQSTVDANATSHYICDLVNSRMRKHLADEKRFGCPHCAKKFKRKKAFNDHLRVHRSEHGPYSCEHCGQRFKHLSHKAIHMRTHTGERPFTCGSCGRSFMAKNTLNQHNRTQHNNFCKYRDVLSST